MILEIAEIHIKPGMETEFEAGVRKAVEIFARAKGCKGMTLRRSVETPSSYSLLVKWETVDNHMVDFRGSEDFKKWRVLVGQCFDGAPEVGNWASAVGGFGFALSTGGA